MKRIFTILFSLLLLLCLSSMTAYAADENDISKFEFPTPKAPNYFVYTDGNASEGHHDDLRMLMLADPDVALLAAEYYKDSDTFYKKYGLYSFNIVMQYDVSLDGENNWQHNTEWDTNWYTSGYADGYPYVSLGSKMMDDFEFFWLTYHEGQGSDTFKPYQPAILTEKYYGDGYEADVYSFDVENHSLYIRCRYYMEWEPLVLNEYGEGPGPKQSKFSAWSESAVFGKNSTQITPAAPATYAAPIISDFKIIPPTGDETNYRMEYTQTTPESVWLTNVYYIMNKNGQFDGLETQVSINGSDWIEFTTVNAWGDWCLWNGSRTVFKDNVTVNSSSYVRLRVRFTGTHGPSEWSNILSVNAPANLNPGASQNQNTTPPSESFKESNPGLPAGNKEETRGSKFGILSAHVVKTTNTSNKLKWNKIKDADGYVVFGALCNNGKNKYKFEVIKVINKNSVTSYKHGKLKKGTYYKYMVQAYRVVDGKIEFISTSKSLHSTTNGGKYGNAVSVKVNNAKIKLKKGGKFTVRAKEIKKAKKIKIHRKIKYESSNTSVATVTDKGLIKAKNKGTCIVYAYAQNGIHKKIKVTVK